MSFTRIGARAEKIIRVRNQEDVLSYYRLHFSRELYQEKRSKIVLARSSIIPDIKFAIKVMPMTTETETKRFLKAKCFLDMTSDLRGVTRICSAFMDAQTGYLLMTFQGLGYLRSVRGRLDAYTWFKIFVEVASTLKRLHARDIYHQNLKPENILLNTGNHVFISDFGAACRLPEDSNDKMVDKYRAPIGYRGPESEHQDDDVTSRVCPFKLDVDCLAVCMWQTVTGKSPLKYNALGELNTDTTRVPEQYRALLRNLLEPEPEKRGTLKDFLSQALQLHPEVLATVGYLC